jgi:hypothetical protein
MPTISIIEGNVTARKRRRKIRVARPVPRPSKHEPSDDELLRFLDGAMEPEERAAFEEKLSVSPYAAARLEVLAEALEENGWPVDDPARGRA